MKLIHWHNSTRAALAGLLILVTSTGVQARKGYLPRIFKRNKAAAVEPAVAVPNVPMGRVVIPLNRLTADDVARMLDDAYGRDNAFSVVEPSRLAKGVIVIGPKSEIDGIREMLAQADPNDRDYLIANKTILPEGVVSEEEFEAELPNNFYAEARKNAEKHTGGGSELAAKGEPAELVRQKGACHPAGQLAAAGESTELVRRRQTPQKASGPCVASAWWAREAVNKRRRQRTQITRCHVGKYRHQAGPCRCQGNGHPIAGALRRYRCAHRSGGASQHHPGDGKQI